MAEPKELPPAPEEELNIKEPEVPKTPKSLVPTLEGGPMNVIMNVASPVKARVQQRRKHLLDLNKTKHEKWKHGNTSTWKDTPPPYHLVEVQSGIDGGVGKITYKVQLRDPATGNRISVGIDTHYVTELFVQGKAISQEIIEVEGAPTLKEALAAQKKEKEDEQRVVAFRRGQT